MYAATEHAVRALSEGLRQEVKQYNIRTTVISPGAVAAELPDSITEADVAATMRKVYEVAVSPDAFAHVVAYALSQPDAIDINEILFRPTLQEVSPGDILREYAADMLSGVDHVGGLRLSRLRSQNR